MGKKLCVEVCNAMDLMPSNGEGSANAFCTLDFDGQRRKTETIMNSLRPRWNCLVEFPLAEGKSYEDQTLVVTIYCEKQAPKRTEKLGRAKISGRIIAKSAEEAVFSYYSLVQEHFFRIKSTKGEVGLRCWWSDEPDAPPPAPAREENADWTQTVAEEAPREVPSPAEAVPAPEPAPVPVPAPAPAPAPAPDPPAPTPAPDPAPAPVPAPIVSAEVPVVSAQAPAVIFVKTLAAEVLRPRSEEEPKQEAKVPEKKNEKHEATTHVHKNEEKPEPKKEKDEKKAKEEAKEKEREVKKDQEEVKAGKKSRREEKEEVTEYKSVERKDKVQEKGEKKADKKEEKKEERKDDEKEKKSENKDEKKRERRGDGPTIVMKRDDDLFHHRKPSTVPPADFNVKETQPVLSRETRRKAPNHDLVEKMNYLFVKVVKARALMEQRTTYAKIVFGSLVAKTKGVGESLNPEWHEVFAFSKETSAGPVVEVSIWDYEHDQFMGVCGFDLQEIPLRVPPDSALAPQWYRLENISRNSENNVRGDIMLAIWWGTQADEAFTEAWQSDSGGYAHTRGKVYLSPKLWYLRVNVIEAQEVQPHDRTRFPEVCVRAYVGFQMYKTKVSANKNTSPQWNEDLMFVVAEPFEEDLILAVLNKTSRPEQDEVLGSVKITLKGVERRTDNKQVASRWYNLDKVNVSEKKEFHGRLHLRVCLDGGYHVMDECTQYSSCVRPTAKQLWKPVVGYLELGIIRGADFHPMKTIKGRGATDAYCIAKYGCKWVKTRTVIDSLSPTWNEQYLWDVFDPCTVLTVAVFDNSNITSEGQAREVRDSQIGKVRIRISTLESERIYTNSHPLLSLQTSGVKKLGELELAVRYSSISLVNVIGLYFTPPLPKMHYLHPLKPGQSEVLRISAMRLVAMRLNRSEPPLRQEVVQYMLDADCNVWSLRRSKVNYYRIMNLLAGPMAAMTWVHDVCHWKSALTTLLVHVLLIILVFYPQLILPTLSLYLGLIGVLKYRHRPRSPPSMDGKLSQAEHVVPDELDEEFDPIPTNKDPSAVKERYDRLRIVSSRIQNVLGDLATQGERVTALLSWRDPRATGIVVALCMTSAMILYVVPMQIVVILFGLYSMRHPRFRNPLPGYASNFFRRLPSLADRIL